MHTKLQLTCTIYIYIQTHIATTVSKFPHLFTGNGFLVSARRYSGEVKICMRPSEKWGACHTEHDDGFTNVQLYQNALDITKGLNFEMYRLNPAEKYRVKYISVDVELN